VGEEIKDILHRDSSRAFDIGNRVGGKLRGQEVEQILNR